MCACDVKAVVTLELLFTPLRSQNHTTETISMWKRSSDENKNEWKGKKKTLFKDYLQAACVHIMYIRVECQYSEIAEEIVSISFFLLFIGFILPLPLHLESSSIHALARFRCRYIFRIMSIEIAAHGRRTWEIKSKKICEWNANTNTKTEKYNETHIFRMGITVVVCDVSACTMFIRISISLWAPSCVRMC